MHTVLTYSRSEEKDKNRLLHSLKHGMALLGDLQRPPAEQDCFLEIERKLKWQKVKYKDGGNCTLKSTCKGIAPMGQCQVMRTGAILPCKVRTMDLGRSALPAVVVHE